MARALYIHWPFCLSKCPYCDFNSHVREAIDMKAWQSALLSDLGHEAGASGGMPLQSIFFGGGTPSLMPPALVGRLLEAAERLWGFGDDIEITLEANPSSVEAANFAALADAGINRVSLGLQSLNDDALKFLGRLHTVDESLAALEVAQRAFSRVSFDLIYALPSQSMSDWQSELSRALGFGTGHLSLYQLTIEPGTRFATLARTGSLVPMHDDTAADMFALTDELTKAGGLPRYEVSNHARPGAESIHNLTYWRYRDYAGIGPGAHGRRGGIATQRHRKPENYLSAVSRNGHGLSEERILGAKEQATEALLMGLRLTEGIEPDELSSRFGLATEDLFEPSSVQRYVAADLLWQTDDRLGVTAQGITVLDALLADIVASDLVEA